ncbi:MAG: ATP phosphoribosyltransferase [Oscillospiraceae bacterium]|nr:ATP phosphoribosyltransferase [Oscillospiraceae bacterium]
MISIALPKGRLGNTVYERFAQAGFDCPEITGAGRKLVFENADPGVRYMLVKPADVAVYVEHGAADIGVVGKDVLEETAPDVYELLDLGEGKCVLAVAGKKNMRDDPALPLRVATKYPSITSAYFSGQNREIEIIKLNGSIELAPILGLSDVIADIVETGATLRENDLCVFATILESSARLIANKSSYQFKKDRIDLIMKGLEATGA